MNRKMKLTDRLNKFIHPWMAKRVMRAYDKKSRRVEITHPELFKHVDAGLSEKHRLLWSRTGLKSGDRWLRLHVNMTGLQDYTFCPEDIFFARIERILNDCNQSGYGYEEKNSLFHYVPRENEPDVVLRYVRGNFFDVECNWLNRSQAAELLKGEFLSHVNMKHKGHIMKDSQLNQPIWVYGVIFESDEIEELFCRSKDWKRRSDTKMTATG